MPRLIVLYPTPSDAQDFEKTFREEHEPLVHAQLAGLRKLTSAGVRSVGDQSAPYHWMAELSFDSMAHLSSALTSDGGLRAAAHARQISTGGPPLMLVLDDDGGTAQPSA